MDVRPLLVSFAAFITPESAAEAPRHISRSEYDMLLLPGIIREGFVGKYDHAAYLGKEMTKAELPSASGGPTGRTSLYSENTVRRESDAATHPVHNAQ